MIPRRDRVRAAWWRFLDWAHEAAMLTLAGFLLLVGVIAAALLIFAASRAVFGEPQPPEQFAAECHASNGAPVHNGDHWVCLRGGK